MTTLKEYRSARLTELGRFADQAREDRYTANTFAAFASSRSEMLVLGDGRG